MIGTLLQQGNQLMSILQASSSRATGLCFFPFFSCLYSLVLSRSLSRALTALSELDTEKIFTSGLGATP